MLSSYVNSATFTSVASGNWNNAATWSQSGADSDGIPDSNDDVIISTGNTVSIVVTSSGNNITVNGTLSIGVGSPLYVWGNYTMDGIETGNGGIGFVGANPTSYIEGTGTFGQQVRYSFSSNRTINAGTDISKASYTSSSIGDNVTVTNLGTMTVGQCASGSNATFLNGATGYLKIVKSDHVTSSFILDASTPGNTVDFTYSNANGLIKTPVGNTYHHLRISGTATKGLMANISVNGNFTTIQGCGFNFRGYNLNVKGNFVSATMTYTQQATSILTLEGSSAQTFACAGNVTTPISNLVINNLAGVNCTNGIITISISLTVAAGNFNTGVNKITLLSNAGATAYIAQSSGTISGTMTVQRYVTARSDGFSDMSSPMTAAAFSNLTDDIETAFVAYVPGVSSPSAWGYNENLWDYIAIESGSDIMSPGNGYEIYLDNDGDTLTNFTAVTIDFSGTPNMGDVPVSCTVDNDGWNLVGNPYASHISFANFISTAGISINGSYLIYDETIEDFASSAANIAPGEGFWIECTTAGDATFKETNKVVSTSSSFRSSDEVLFALRVTSDRVKNTSNTYFRFNENAGLGYEANHDQTFLKLPDPKAPSLYTQSFEGRKLRVNELKAENSLVIPVSFRAGVNGNYSILALNIENVWAEGYTSIILEDKLTGIFYDLGNSDYLFESEAGQFDERFVLHLKKSETESIQSNEDVSFFNSQEGVFVNFNLPEMKGAYITVYNMAGQEISETTLFAAENNRFKINMPANFSGAYLIRVILDDKIFTQRYYKQ